MIEKFFRNNFISRVCASLLQPHNSHPFFPSFLQDNVTVPYVSPDVSGLHFAETFDGDVAWRNNDQGSLNYLLRGSRNANLWSF